MSRQNVNEEGEKSRTSTPKVQHPVTPCVLTQMVMFWRNSALRKMRTSLQKSLNFWPSEWRKPKKKMPGTDPQEMQAVSTESFYLDMSVKNGSLEVTHKWLDLQKILQSVGPARCSVGKGACLPVCLPWTFMVDKENRLQPVVLWLPHMSYGSLSHTHKIYATLI